MRALTVIIVLLISFTGIAQENTVLKIDFEISRYDNGSIYVAIYDSEDTFLKKPLKGTIVEIEDGKASATIIELEPGEYAVSSFYDKNGNVYSYSVYNYVKNPSIQDNNFVFNKSDYPKVEVIDLR